MKNEELSFEPLGEESSTESIRDISYLRTQYDKDSKTQVDMAEAKSISQGDSKILDEKLAFSSDCARSYLEGNDEAQSRRIADLSLKAESQKPTPKQKITHTLIIGDNYPALLNLLIEYRKRVRVIYIDPPYGKDDLGEFAHTNYDNAITRDNLLSMLYPRLSLAKMLLQDDGVIFCSIDDRNQAYVKGLFDEVFGEGNFVVCYPIATNHSVRNYGGIPIAHEYVLIHQKDVKSDELNLLTNENKNFTFCDENGNFNLMELRNRNSKVNSKNRPNLYYPFYVNLNNQDENDLYEVSLTQHNCFLIERSDVCVIPINKIKQIETLKEIIKSKQSNISLLNSVLFERVLHTNMPQIIK